MTFTVAIMYPNPEHVEFNDDYYMKTHMPLVEKSWKSFGLISWRVNKFPAALDGSRSEYLIQATLEWESEDALKAALGSPASADVFGDIPNFTNVKPISLKGVTL
ncbi:uncharacterized protein N7515_009449 [Penicillium bovifimosum]|uniref:Ethyl tert-butyl ether degradation EthD n=1 Tax=Penicillium bovifimosum TaxID=126998 RepID=A0A9W9GJB1_9EURO|nr:uncharacterized protein N7515_009449 [Penicillium bovifimosum]KAJ5121488.1 hypothetical protein N7515_009449 [Penicillium bovifimosum]